MFVTLNPKRPPAPSSVIRKFNRESAGVELGRCRSMRVARLRMASIPCVIPLSHPSPAQQ